MTYVLLSRPTHSLFIPIVLTVSEKLAKISKLVQNLVTSSNFEANALDNRQFLIKMRKSPKDAKNGEKKQFLGQFLRKKPKTKKVQKTSNLPHLVCPDAQLSLEGTCPISSKPYGQFLRNWSFPKGQHRKNIAERAGQDSKSSMSG